MISVLIADDEQPALDELAYLLGLDPRVSTVYRASTGAEAVRQLTAESVDAVFLDIHMPGLSGFDLARTLARFDRRPALVFVTADEEGAIEAFELAAVDYLLKPVRAARLERSLSRVIQSLQTTAPAPQQPEPQSFVTVSVGSTTRMIQRDEVRFVQAQGDYARLHTASGSHLARIPMSDLERQWTAHGFVRIHRSYLVALRHVTRLRLAGQRPTVELEGAELPVSRRLLPALREALAANRLRSRR